MASQDSEHAPVPRDNTQVVVRPRRPLRSLVDIHCSMVDWVVDSVPDAFKTMWTEPDGNCMFHAFAKAVPGAMVDHVMARSAAVHHMRDNWVDFVHFIDDDSVVEYLDKMYQQGTWGDNLTLQALCAVYGVHCFVLKQLVDGWTWVR
jgi:hypothetical protein